MFSIITDFTIYYFIPRLDTHRIFECTRRASLSLTDTFLTYYHRSPRVEAAVARLSVLTPGAPGGGGGGAGGAGGPPNVFGLASRAPDDGLSSVSPRASASSPTRFADASGPSPSVPNGRAVALAGRGGPAVASADDACAGRTASATATTRIEWTPAVLERCALVQMLVQLAVASPPLADELYLQLIKLTTDSPGVRIRVLLHCTHNARVLHFVTFLMPH